MRIHYIGLGKMGKNMVLRLLEKGHEVHAWNRSPEPRAEVKQSGAVVYETVEELLISTPNDVRLTMGDCRVIWLMLPAGEATKSMITKIAPLLSPGDVLVDGANGFYKDACLYADLLKQYHVRYIDVGVSGGPSGARSGACLMIGGEREVFEKLVPLFADISAGGNAYAHFEGAGAGQFVKMVHNGIEYGMMQAIAEGFSVMHKSPFGLDLIKVGEIYQKRSVIESRLVQWTLDGLKRFGVSLSDISGSIKHNGEGKWTVEAAKELGVPTPIIEGSFQFRIDSTNHPSYTGKLVSLMRTMFGGHEVREGQ